MSRQTWKDGWRMTRSHCQSNIQKQSQLEVREMLGLNLSEELRAIREAREEGREAQAIALVSRQLKRRLQQDLSDEMQARLSKLPLADHEDLSEALLDFTTLADLEGWLKNRE